MLKTRNVILGLVILLALGLGWSRLGGESGNKSGRTGAQMTIPRSQRGGNLNYMLAWTPTGAEGGPLIVRLSGNVDTTSTNNPFYYQFKVPSGTVLRVKAVALVGEDQQRGWLECAFFDAQGELLVHAGPTDAINGCTVKGVAP
jgi:hypothetical protein